MGMFIFLIFTITSITSTHLKSAYAARHYGSTDDLPQEKPIYSYNDHCVLELFDEYYTYSTCSNLISMSYDMKDDLKQVKSFDCNCTLDWASPPKKMKYFNLKKRRNQIY